MSLIVLVGPAGVGKGSVVKELLKHGGYRLSVSATTREPRAGEVDGQHYHFVSSREFEQMIENAELIEWAKVHGNHYYGTPKAELERAAAESAHLILEIDLQGARQIAGAGMEHIGIFLEPPSWEELERRLRSRGTETESEIQTRLATAREELAAADEFENRLVNDDLGTTAQRIRELVTKKGREEMTEAPQGIVAPPIDELLEKVGSNYELVIFASKRARQINEYYSALHEGSLFNYVGPLVDSTIDDKPLSIALHEIHQGKLEKKSQEK